MQTNYLDKVHLRLILISFVAIAGSDYISASSYMTYTSGSTDNAVRCITVSILEDAALEGNQTFTVMLSTSDPDVMLGISMTTVIITDNLG